MIDFRTIVEQTIIPHTSYGEARDQIETCFQCAGTKSESEGLAILGESGTGKTSLLEELAKKYPPVRTRDGMVIPVLMATVPSAPTVKNLAGTFLSAMNASDAWQGTEYAMSARLRKLIQTTGVKVIAADEFQHFYDRPKHTVMHQVADWLKTLIDQTRCTLIIAGLPSSWAVIDSNKQLTRRFLAPITLPQFSWQECGDRAQFQGILAAFESGLGAKYDLISLSSETNALRLFCATAGLMGYLTKLLKQAERNANAIGSKKISMSDLSIAYRQAIWYAKDAVLPDPFSEEFSTAVAFDMTERVRDISRPHLEQGLPRRGGSKTKRASISSMLVAR